MRLTQWDFGILYVASVVRESVVNSIYWSGWYL